MLILVKNKEGKEIAINAKNYEFEASVNKNDVSLYDVTFKKNDEKIQVTMSEKLYHDFIDKLENQNILIRLNDA